VAVESAESWPATRAPICKPVLGHLGLATNRHASRADGIAGVIAAGVDLGPLADGVDPEAGGLRDEPIGALALAGIAPRVRGLEQVGEAARQIALLVKALQVGRDRAVVPAERRQERGAREVSGRRWRWRWSRRSRSRRRR
jgi:hypothetical protein